MNYRPFHLSRIGAAHIRKGFPCQDSSADELYHDAVIAVVADGHGSRRHFRSDRGSAIACRVAIECIRKFLDEEPRNTPFDQNRIAVLKQRVCDEWINAVRRDYEENPWTDEELEEEKALLTSEQFTNLSDGTDAPVAYGSTLCAVFARDDCWAAVQLGDGCLCLIDNSGVYDWPMPESQVNEGNRTASLCMREPMRDFRHCSGSGRPAGLLVYTDGIEKIFPPQGKEVISLLHWIWRNEYSDDEAVRKNNLTRTLDTLTARSHIGDDLSVAGLVNLNAEDAAPVPGRNQKLQELDRMYARLAELDSMIDYHKQQLRQALRPGGSVETRTQLKDILQRDLATAVLFCDQIAEEREALGLGADPSLNREPSLDRDLVLDQEPFSEPEPIFEVEAFPDEECFAPDKEDAPDETYETDPLFDFETDLVFESLIEKEDHPVDDHKTKKHNRSVQKNDERRRGEEKLHPDEQKAGRLMDLMHRMFDNHKE